MIQNLNDNSTNREIKIDRKDYIRSSTGEVIGKGSVEQVVEKTTNPAHTEEFFDSINAIQTWVDRNIWQHQPAIFAHELRVRLFNTTEKGYILKKD